MPLFEVGLTHQQVDAGQLLAIAASGPGLERRLREAYPDLILGAVVLSTCNRFEVYAHATEFHRGARAVRAEIAASAPALTAGSAALVETRSRAAAVEHLFEVTAGMDSMVVGENEIAGQVRNALARSEEVSAPLRRLFQSALNTSKNVSASTQLGAAGRSVATVGLDLVDDCLTGPGASGLAGRRVLLLGTGSFARVVVAELGRRGAGPVRVYSSRGRARSFARSHPVVPIEAEQLAEAFGWAEVVVGCSGAHSVPVGAELVGSAREGRQLLPILDLSLEGDVEAGVGELDQVRLIGLDEIGRHAPPEQAATVQAAARIVAAGVQHHLDIEEGRLADPVVTMLRDHINALINHEIELAHRRHDPGTAQVIERALRRTGNTLLHEPTVRAADLARAGRLEDFSAAVHTVFGWELGAS